MTRTHRVFAFLWRWLTVFLPVAVAVLLAVSGIVKSDFKLSGHEVETAWVLIGVAGILAAAEAALVTRRQRRLSQLEAEQGRVLARAEAAEASLLHLLRDELIAIEFQAHLYSNERINVFRCDRDGFTLVARRSRRPLLTKASAVNAIRLTKASSVARGPMAWQRRRAYRHRVLKASLPGEAGSWSKGAAGAYLRLSQSAS